MNLVSYLYVLEMTSQKSCFNMRPVFPIHIFHHTSCSSFSALRHAFRHTLLLALQLGLRRADGLNEVKGFMNVVYTYVIEKLTERDIDPTSFSAHLTTCQSKKRCRLLTNCPERISRYFSTRSFKPVDVKKIVHVQQTYLKIFRSVFLLGIDKMSRRQRYLLYDRY